jgi:glycerol-3-phosphate cytidylyltransferase
MSIVYTGGTFDLFHSGHVNFLRQCDEIAGKNGKVVVSLNTDDFIMEYKGKPPICDYSERAAVLLGCRYVSEVIANVGGKDSKIAILGVDPDYIVIGSDWESKDYYSQMMFSREWLDDQGIELLYVPYTEAISTTEIKRRINS